MTAARILRIPVQLVVSGGLLYLVFRRVDLRRSFSSIESADPFWLLAGIVVLFAVLLLKAFRLRYILWRVKRIPVLTLFSCSIIGSMFNASLPAKSGSLAFAYWLGKKNAVSKSTSLAAILLPQIIDAAVLVFLTLILVYFVLPEAGAFRAMFWTAGVSVLLIIGCLAGLAGQRERVREWIQSVIGRWFPKGSGILTSHIDHFAEGLDIIKKKGRLVNLIFMSAPVIICYLLRIQFILFGMGISVGFSAVVVVWVFANIGTLAPSIVGNIGPYEFMVVIALRLFGVKEDAALAAALVLHFLILAPVMLAGLANLWREKNLTPKPVV